MAGRAKKTGSEGKGKGAGTGQASTSAPQPNHLSPDKMRAIAAKQMLRQKAMMLDGPPRREFEVETITSPPQSLIGGTGIPRGKHGIPKMETNPELSPYKARGYGEDPGIFDDILRTDGTGAGSLALVVRGISTAPADIWSPPNPTRAEAEGVELARRFFGLDGHAAWLRGGLARHVRQACRALPYGFQSFEKVWRPHVWRGRPILAPSGIYQRASRSVKGWVWKGDDMIGMTQRLLSDEKGSDGYFDAARSWGLDGDSLGLKDGKTVTIPAAQLLLYTYDPSGEVEGAPEGLSILRPAWVWWKTKRDLIVRYHMAADRLFGGVTLLDQLLDRDGVPQGSETDLDAWDDAFAAWVEGNVDWLAVPTGWEVNQSYPEFQLKSPHEFLRYCDDQMRLVFAAQLLGGNTGASSEISAQMLYTSMDQVAAWIAEVINGQPDVPTTGLVRDLIDAVIPHDETYRYPKLYFKAVEYRHVKSYADTLTKLMQYYGLTYTVEGEQYMREMLDMPLLTPEQVAARKAFEALRLTTTTPSADASQAGTQAPVTPPQEQPVDDPDGEDDAG